jgi:hypothetical protein
MAHDPSHFTSRPYGIIAHSSLGFRVKVFGNVKAGDKYFGAIVSSYALSRLTM